MLVLEGKGPILGLSRLILCSFLFLIPSSLAFIYFNNFYIHAQGNMHHYYYYMTYTAHFTNPAFPNYIPYPFNWGPCSQILFHN